MSGQKGKAGLLLTMTLEERRELHRQARAAHMATARFVMQVVRQGCGLGGAAPLRREPTVTERLRKAWRYPGEPRTAPGAGPERALGGRRRARAGEGGETGARSVPGADAGPERPGRAGNAAGRGAAGEGEG
jgi:hypothetical protein